MPDKKVLDLIRQLQEIRIDRGATPAEAITAAHHVQRLLEKHQLSLLDVEAGTLAEGMEVESLDLEGQVAWEWFFSLAGAVSRPFDCEYIIRTTREQGRKKLSVSFAGYESDVRVARFLFVYLSRLLMEMGDRDGRLVGRSGASLIAFRKHYVRSAAIRIEERLQEQKTAQQQASVNCRALVAVKAAPVKAFFQEQFPDCKEVKPAPLADPDAFQLGRKTGSTIDLHQAIESQGQPPAIGQR